MLSRVAKPRGSFASPHQSRQVYGWISEQGRFINRFRMRSHLSMSLLVKFPNVPEEGYTLSEYDRACDVQESFCRTPLHVWEIHCPECRSSGKVPVNRKRKTRILAVCPRCSGLGFVRYVSSEISEEDEEGFSLMRSPGDYYQG